MSNGCTAPSRYPLDARNFKSRARVAGSHDRYQISGTPAAATAHKRRFVGTFARRIEEHDVGLAQARHAPSSARDACSTRPASKPHAFLQAVEPALARASATAPALSSIPKTRHPRRREVQRERSGAAIQVDDRTERAEVPARDSSKMRSTISTLTWKNEPRRRDSARRAIVSSISAVPASSRSRRPRMAFSPLGSNELTIPTAPRQRRESAGAAVAAASDSRKVVTAGPPGRTHARCGRPGGGFRATRVRPRALHGRY